MPVSLVTGAAGFIGSHVSRHLSAAGHRVVALDDLSGGFQDQADPQAIFVKGSVTDPELLEKLFKEYKFDYVFHLAAYAAEGLSHFIRRFNYTNNVIGSMNLINESVNSGVKCFVFTSSIAVYGSARPPMTEETLASPEDPYGIAKLAVEMDLKAAHEMFGINYVIFRPHNVYGEFQNIGDRYRNVVGIFMNQLLQGKPLTVFGDGNQKRAFSYISDVAPYIAASAENPDACNQVFNIGADREFTVNELAEAVMKAMGIKGTINHLPPRVEAVNAWADHSKAKKILKIGKAVALDEGLKKMADWVKKTGARKSGFFNNIEIRKKLPGTWLEE